MMDRGRSYKWSIVWWLKQDKNNIHLIKCIQLKLHNLTIVSSYEFMSVGVCKVLLDNNKQLVFKFNRQKENRRFLSNNVMRRLAGLQYYNN